MIIKSDALSAHSPVRPIHASSIVEQRSAAAEELDGLRTRVGQLDGQLAQHEGVIEKLRKDVDASFRRGRDEGFAAGLEAAEDHQSERLELLAKATERANADVRDGLEQLERNAILVARQCLDILLGDAGGRLRLVQDMIRHQLERIDPTSLLRVEVSAEDFQDIATLDRLCDDTGLPREMVVGRADLPTGGCEIALNLGRLDIGIDQQWGVLRRALDDMIVPGDRS